MSKGTPIPHPEALRLIDARIGETVSLSLLVGRADPDDPEGPTPFVNKVGTLENPLEPKPPRLDPDVGFYGMGGESFCFPPMAGTIELRDDGVDFHVAETVSIRLAWRGSEEMGSHWSNPADVPRLMARGQRARAEILTASPTGHKVGAGEDERRIWSLRLRVHPDGEPAFEARAEHGFRLSPDFEEKIERGHSVDMLPAGRAEVEVAYDPDDREWVIVRPLADGDGSTQGIRLSGIVGLPPGQLPGGIAPPRRPDSE